MTDIAPPRAPLFLPDLLMAIFLRLVAVSCLWYGLVIWGDLIGYRNGGILRFDLLNNDMKAAGATLAILYPVAAIGLWLRGPWGPVIWSVAAITEVTMHEVYAEIFGPDRLKSVAIGLIVIVYFGLRLATRFGRPKDRRLPFGG